LEKRNVNRRLLSSFSPALILAGLFAAAAVFAPQTSFAQQAVAVVVNGQQMNFDQPPVVQAGRVFVPMRAIFEQLGASVVYANGEINATGAGNTVSLTIGSTQASVNGQRVTLDVAPFLIGSRTLVPLRFVAQSLGASVNWNDSDATVTINSGSSQNYSGYSGGAGYSDYSNIDTPPPPLPVYEQPEAPAPNHIWTPGYWAWGPAGYYWVPGTWAAPPQFGLYWTPGYWAASDNGFGFMWHPGYWAPEVGYYGGISYGFGYFGNGYEGGRWGSNGFAYNTAYSRVNRTIINNTYINRTIINTTVINRVSYNGGPGGVRVRPTAQQLIIAKRNHAPMTLEQVRHERAAAQDRDLYVTANHGQPALPAVVKPLAAPPPGAMAPTQQDKRAAQLHIRQPQGPARPPSTPTLVPKAQPGNRPITTPEVMPTIKPVHREIQPTPTPEIRPAVKPEVVRTPEPIHHEPRQTPRPEIKPLVKPTVRPVHHAPPVKPEMKPPVKPAPKPTEKPSPKPSEKAHPR
jgi:hypothetical protein